MQKMSKHIGIVGCSAEGAALCYKSICAMGPELMGEHAHPQVSMHTPSLAEYVDCLECQDVTGIADLMLASANKLASIGAEFAICPDNTIHQAFERVEAESPIPWLHIADPIVALAKEKGYQKLGILGTSWLVQSQVYPDKLDAAGLQWLRPTPEQREALGRIIMQELIYGEFKPESVAYFQSVIRDMRQAGCDAVILGCTEIPLIINDNNSALPCLDSNLLLARAALKYALAPA